MLTPEDMPCEANAVLNPGVAEVDGDVVLLLRIENKDGISQIRVARSHNGVDNWRYADRPILQPGISGFPYEEWGCEDARVTRMDGNEWAIAYTAYSRHGPIIALATTSDFQQADRLGTTLIPANKDAALFSGRINGQFYVLHRPDVGGAEDIWYASSTQHLTHWTDPGLLMERRGGLVLRPITAGFSASGVRIPIQSPGGCYFLCSVTVVETSVTSGSPTLMLTGLPWTKNPPTRPTGPNRIAPPIVAPAASPDFFPPT